MSNFNERAKEAVLKYNKSGAVAIAEEAIKAKADIADLIQNGFTAGITEVGQMFEDKKIYLPHVMAAAAAMTAAVDVLGPALEAQKKSGKAAEEKTRGDFVICAIEGDIHSIGKDIVAIMLKVAGFRVHNIGRDIPIRDIIQACKDRKAKFVGTSSLMTSTMVNQKRLEILMRNDGIRDKIVTNVGGAPVTQEWADEIGADVYSESASDCVAKFIALTEDA